MNMATPNSDSSSSFSLANLGRSSFVSQSGLSDTLRKLHEAGLLLKDIGGISRQSVKRARERELEQTTTRFGPLIKTLGLKNEDGKVIHEVPIIDPVPLFSHVVEHCPGFQEFFFRRLGDQPCSHQAPWGLVIYADEIVSGNPLRHGNPRKCQALYWSWIEFQQDGLSREDLWFPLAIIRSSKVNDCGGLTVVWPQLLATRSDSARF